MHGTEHCNRTLGALRLSAPQRTFSPSAGSMPSGALPVGPDQDRLLVTAFRSPVTAAPSRGLHPGVKVPGLLLRFLPLVHTARSDFWLVRRPRFAPGDGEVYASIPLRRLRAVQSAAPAISTPLRDCYLPRDQSVQPLRLPIGPPSRFARFPLAPRSPYLLLELSATDHRSWFATFPEARCSSNLLEPIPLCSRQPDPSILFCLLQNLFNSIYFILFTMG